MSHSRQIKSQFSLEHVRILVKYCRWSHKYTFFYYILLHLARLHCTNSLILFHYIKAAVDQNSPRFSLTIQQQCAFIWFTKSNQSHLTCWTLKTKLRVYLLSSALDYCNIAWMHCQLLCTFHFASPSSISCLQACDWHKLDIILKNCFSQFKEKKQTKVAHRVRVSFIQLIFTI